jgi:hypothetical protein
MPLPNGNEWEHLLVVNLKQYFMFENDKYEFAATVQSQLLPAL